jgi:hypothetical protein
VDKIYYKKFVGAPQKLGVKAVGEGDASAKKIPKDVQNRMVEEAKKEGFSVKRGLKGGIPGFLSALILAVIDEWNKKEEN